MRIIEFKESPLQVAEKVKFSASEKVVGITIKNQGTSNVLTSFGSDSNINIILPQTSESYGIEGYYMDGYVSIDFEAGGTDSVVIKKAVDKGCFKE